MSHGYQGYIKGCRCVYCIATGREYFRLKHLRGPGPLGDGTEISPSHEALRDLLNELFPLGLTDDCPARQKAAA